MTTRKVATALISGALLSAVVACDAPLDQRAGDTLSVDAAAILTPPVREGDSIRGLPERVTPPGAAAGMESIGTRISPNGVYDFGTVASPIPGRHQVFTMWSPGQDTSP